MLQKLLYFLVSLTALLLIGCSDEAPKEFDLDQLTRVDVIETTSTTGYVILEEKDLDIIREAYKEVKWNQDVTVEMEGERTAEATFFYTYNKNMPERLFEYEVYLREDGSLSLQNEEEGYGELSKEHAESLKTLFFKNK